MPWPAPLLCLGDWAWHIAAIAVVIEVVLLKLVRIEGMPVPEIAFFAHQQYFWHHAIALRWMHQIAGAVFLVIAMFQFWPSFRHANIERHKMMGRIGVLCSFSAFLGLVWMLIQPGFLFACTPEVPDAELEHLPRTDIRLSDCPSQSTWWGVLTFGPHLFITLVVAVYYIKTAQASTDKNERERRIVQHRRWMIRHTANAVSVGTFRAFGMTTNILLDFLMGKLDPRSEFGRNLWAWWIVDLTLAELYIQFHLPVVPAAVEESANQELTPAESLSG